MRAVCLQSPRAAGERRGVPDEHPHRRAARRVGRCGGAARQAGCGHGERWRRGAGRSRGARDAGGERLPRPPPRIRAAPPSSRTSPSSARTRRSCASRSSPRCSATSPATTASRASTATYGKPAERDVDRHGRAGRGVDREAARRGAAAPPRAHLLRRRAAAERAGDVRNRRALLEARRVARRPQLVNIITNGLLLTPEVVERMLPLGLTGVKVTLDGDRDTHDRMRPLRGGQGTFDRIIENVRRVAPLVPVTIGGNFDGDGRPLPGAARLPQGAGLRGRISKVAFKPIIKPARPGSPSAAIPAQPVEIIRRPLNGSCMTAAGPSTGGASVDAARRATAATSLDDKMSFLREETQRRGFPTADGVHMGPCEIHRRHSHTIGPDGSLYACPGFTGEFALAVGHIDGRPDAEHAAAARRFDRLAPWRQCGDCAFIPVCGGGCAVAAHAELGDMDAPSCHKRSLESALASLADEAARDQSQEGYNEGQDPEERPEDSVAGNVPVDDWRAAGEQQVDVQPSQRGAGRQSPARAGASPRRRQYVAALVHASPGRGRGAVCLRLSGPGHRPAAAGRSRRPAHGDHRRAAEPPTRSQPRRAAHRRLPRLRATDDQRHRGPHPAAPP